MIASQAASARYSSLTVNRSAIALSRSDGMSSMSDSLRRRRATRRWSASTPTTSQPASAKATASGRPDVAETDDPYLHPAQG